MNTSFSDDEIYYRLKYFYHIDVKKLTARLKDVPAHKKDTDSLFFYVFSQVTTSSKLFSEYLLSDTDIPYASFFNFFSKDTNICSVHKTITSLCRISLFHHCLLHGFNNQLHKTSLKNILVKTKYNDYPELIPLTSATDYDIEKGYFASLYSQKNSTEKKDPFTPQKYNSIYYKRLNSNRQGFSFKILMQNQQEVCDKLNVPVSQSNPLLFLLKNPHAKFLDNALQNEKNSTNKNLLKKYITLANDADIWKSQKLTNKVDLLLFDHTLESSYHFILLKNIGNFLLEITNTNPISPYHIFYGESFLEIIRNSLMYLPVTYNQLIFLEYACHAALYSDNLTDPLYPPLPNSALGQRLSFLKQSDDQRTVIALQQMGYFFRMLNYCTIPLLEDLWDVLTSEKYGIVKLTIDDYLNFVNDNYLFMKADYHSFAHEIDSNSIWKLQDSYGNYDFERVYHSFSSCIHQLNIKEKPFPDFCYQTTLQNQFSSLIRTITQLPSEKRRSIDNIIFSQSNDYRNKTAYQTEYDLLEKDYLNILYSFIKKISPAVPF